MCMKTYVLMPNTCAWCADYALVINMHGYYFIVRLIQFIEIK